MNKERLAVERTAKAQRPPAGQSCLPRSRCPDLRGRRKMRARPQPPRHVRAAAAREAPTPDRTGPACAPAVPGRPWLPGLPHSVLDSQPKSCPRGRCVKRAQVARGFRGGNQALYRCAGFLAEPLGRTSQAPRVAPSAQPSRIPLVDGGLVAGFNGGIIFTQQTPLEVS